MKIYFIFYIILLKLTLINIPKTLNTELEIDLKKIKHKENQKLQNLLQQTEILSKLRKIFRVGELIKITY